MTRSRLYDGDSVDWVRVLEPREGIAGLADLVQPALLIAGWTAAFLLGKELQGALTQWLARRRSQ